MSDADTVLLAISQILDHSELKDPKAHYTSGGCFDFYEKLKGYFPDAVPRYDGNHVTVQIGTRTYDATGLKTYDLRDEPALLEKANLWSVGE